MFSVPNVLFMGLFVKATRRSQNLPYQGSRFGINLLSKVKACSGVTRQVADFIMVCLTSLDPSRYPSLDGIVSFREGSHILWFKFLLGSGQVE